MKYIRYPKRDVLRDYFPVLNEIFCLGLSSGEISVYAYLLRCENRKTFQCHPSYKTIGNAVGMSKNTVKKYLRRKAFDNLKSENIEKIENSSKSFLSTSAAFTACLSSSFCCSI